MLLLIVCCATFSITESLVAPQNDTAALQQMLDAAHSVGGGRVTLAAGHTYISFGLQLYSNITLVIDGTLSTDGNPASSWHTKKSLLAGTGLTNTTVIGTGTIDGRGAAWWPLRKKDYSVFAPFIFSCNHCSDITIKDIHVINTPAWGIGFEAGKNILIDNISIHSPKDSPNTDGVDMNCHGGPEQPCILRNSVIYNGDDEVAVSGANVLVEDCEFGDGHGASIGSLGFNHSHAYVSNITFRNLFFNRTSTTIRIKTWQGGMGEC
jgi:polygalacturonase